MKFRIRFADQIVGFFIITAIILIAILLVLIGMNQRWFSTNYYFHSTFTSAQGLAPGTAITFKGFEIGKTESISLNKANQIDLRFYIYDTYIDKVKLYSIIELSSSPIPGLGGGLLFHQGRSDQPIPKNSFIPALGSVEAQELIESNKVDIPKKDDTISRTIGNLNELMSNLNNAIEGHGEGPLKDIIGDVKKTTDSLSDKLGRGGSISNSLETIPSIIANINTTTQNIATLSEKLKDPKGIVPYVLGDGSVSTFLSDDDRLYNEVQSLMKQIDTLMVTFNTAAKDVQRTTKAVADETPKLSSLLLQTKQAIGNAQDVMEGLKNNPFLRGGINPKPQQDARLESLRRQDF